MILQNITVFFPVIFGFAFLLYMFWTRSKYKNRSKGGLFFFEDGCLVLNTGFPQPVPMMDVEYVELEYNEIELEYNLSYGLLCKVVEKNGKTRKCFQKCSRYATYGLPADMAASLEERGIRCVLVGK